MNEPKNKPLASPFRWVGAKNRMRSKIAPILEEARRGLPVYVEPFGGSSAMLLALTPVAREVYNDADGRLVDFFRRNSRLKRRKTNELSLRARLNG